MRPALFCCLLAAGPLCQLNQVIGRRRRVEELQFAVRPANLNVCKMRFGAEAEVEAEVARRVVAGAATHLIDPETFCRLESCASSYSIAAGRGADETHAEPVVLCF